MTRWKKNPVLEQARPSANLRSPKLNFDFTAERRNAFSAGYPPVTARLLRSTRAGVTCHPLTHAAKGVFFATRR